ncbi:hypothetical protein V496_01420 [Pseudogymnoascus sp. VKM F-4515 (FW-2607)]|nr:hypothetical protein V496_01420 [Pseudogymnoascus sp. VKM F-4515 (FW-2607)]
MASGGGSGFGARLAKAFRPKASSKLQKRPKPSASGGTLAEGSGVPQYERSPSPMYHKEAVVDSQLGERQDNTALLHSLVYDDEIYDEQQLARATATACHPKYHPLSRIPVPIWDAVLDYLTPFEAASLAFTTKELLWRFGFRPWEALNLPENHQYKIHFLLTMDEYLPNHLLCFLCASYHYRIHHGNETLKPAAAHNPLYKCPKAFELPFPRTRITPRRNLPFSGVSGAPVERGPLDPPEPIRRYQRSSTHASEQLLLRRVRTYPERMRDQTYTEATRFDGTES